MRRLALILSLSFLTACADFQPSNRPGTAMPSRVQRNSELPRHPDYLPPHNNSDNGVVRIERDPTSARGVTRTWDTPNTDGTSNYTKGAGYWKVYKMADGSTRRVYVPGKETYTRDERLGDHYYDPIRHQGGKLIWDRKKERHTTTYY